ncbi:MAG: nitroreductase family deazaflavin-dependent oxidoreductase [Anaerolineae bacterium]
MTEKAYSPVQNLVQKMAATKPGSWFFARTLHTFDRVVVRMTHGRTTLTSILSGLPVVLLTTTGAKSGLPRTLPLICLQDNDDANTIAIVASNWGQHKNPAWYYNLKANPQAKGRIKGIEKSYVAREATGAEYEKFWQQAMNTYPGFPNYKIRASHRHIPIMVLRTK